MAAEGNGLVRVKIARTRLAAVRSALRAPSPEELGCCIPLLDEAAACLQSLETVSQPQPAEWARELEALRFEIGVVRRMVEGGAQFYEGWVRILAMASGYTPTGNPAPLAPAGSVSVHG